MALTIPHSALPPRDAPASSPLVFHPRALAALVGVAFGLVGFVGLSFLALGIGLDHPAYGLLYAVGLVSPFLGALAYAWISAGSLRPILALYWPLRFGPGAWMILLVPLSICGAYAAVGMAGLPFDPAYLPTFGAFALAALGWSSIMWAEETGWRGVLLPVFQERLGPLSATVLVALAWTIWHVPLLLLLGLPAAGFAWFAAQSLGMSLAMTWALNRTGTALVPMLIHGVNNATMMAFVGAVPGFSDAELLPVQALGPIALGLVVMLATRGTLGFNE